MDCPTCQNDPSQSVVTALVNRKGKCFLEVHPCPTCDGGGAITLDQYERMITGREFRVSRIGMAMTIGQMAQYAGITPRAVSDYEEGRLSGPISDATRDAIFSVIAAVKALKKSA